MHEQCTDVLAVSAALDISVRVVIQHVANGASDRGEVRDGSVVHEGEFSKYERVVVDVSDGAFGRGTDVSKDAAGFGVGADGTVVHVAFRRLDGLVDGGSEAFVRLAIFALAGDASFKVAVGGSVPGYTETVGVEDAVASIGFVFCSGLVWQVGDEARQIVIVDLIGERVLRCDEDVRQQTRLGWRDVCEPTA